MGRKSWDREYIQRHWRKCESKALFKNDETLIAGEEVCRKDIGKYYEGDVLECLREKEKRSKQKLSKVYGCPVWRILEVRLKAFIENLSEEGEEEVAV